MHFERSNKDKTYAFVGYSTQNIHYTLSCQSKALQVSFFKYSLLITAMLGEAPHAAYEDLLTQAPTFHFCTVI